MALTAEEIVAVKQDWQMIRDKPEGQVQFGKAVFTKLFTENPDYLSKFKRFEGLSLDEVKTSEGLQWHAHRFCSSINAVVGVLEDADAVHVILHELGRAHTTRDVSEEQIKKAVEVFHHCLTEELGGHIRSQVGWQKLVDIIIREMGDGLKI